jgi:parvulin-like peptidyl-prolyl isomerase
MMLRQGLQIGPQEALGQLIAEQLIGQAAEQAGQVVSASEVDAEFARLAEQSGGAEELIKQLADAGLTPDDVKSDLRRQMNLKKVLDWKTAQIEIPDASVAEVLQSDPQSLERVKARHILIRSSEEDSEEEKTDAKTRIGAIADRLKAGEDFAEVAQQESEDPGSAVRGGDLGEFARGDMVPPFEEAAFSLEPGTISEIVQSQFGYHLIKSEERRTLTEDEVRDDLRKQMGNQVLRSWIAELQEDATIEFAPRLAPVGPGAAGR